MTDLFRSLFDPNRSIALFVIGTAMLTVSISVLYDTVQQFAGLPGAWAFGVLLLAIAAAAIAVAARRRGETEIAIAETEHPARRAGLIVLVSPHEGTAPAAIDYHLGPLRVLWLIASPASLKTAEALYQRYKDRVAEIIWGQDYEVDPEGVAGTYQKLLEVLDQAGARGLAPRELIADITGGLKPMTAGMSLACLARGVEMQYMKASRDASGKEDPLVKTHPIRIDTSLIAPGPGGFR